MNCFQLVRYITFVWRYNVGGDGPEDEEGVTQSVKSLSQIVAQEHENGIGKVLLGGFSQGACMSLFMGVTLEDLRITGIVMLSGKIVLPDKMIELWATRNISILPPSLIIGYHPGDEEYTSVHCSRNGRRRAHAWHEYGVCEALKGAGFHITENANAVEGISYHLYEGLAHSVDLSQEVNGLKDWLKKNVPQDPISQSSG